MVMFNLVLSFILLHANPFKIDFPVKKEMSNEDYALAQSKLMQIDIDPLLNRLYPVDWRHSDYYRLKAPIEIFRGRLYRSLNQVMIHSAADKFPQKGLLEINEGKDQCIVLFCSHDKKYPNMLKELLKNLEEIGYDGFIWYRIGGYPNPTGEEIQYAGVPYAFKLFMMEEAFNLGFRHVLWLDTAMVPIRNPNLLFDLIRQEGVLIKEIGPQNDYILPSTHQEIEKLTGVDVLNCKHVRMSVFGLDKEAPFAPLFLKTYREMVYRGTPFFSHLPEEFVITALKQVFFPNLPNEKVLLQGPEYFTAKQQGYFFVNRHH